MISSVSLSFLAELSSAHPSLRLERLAASFRKQMRQYCVRHLKHETPHPGIGWGLEGIVGDWIQNPAQGDWKRFVNLAALWGWGIGGDLCRVCNSNVSSCPYES